MKFAKGDVVYLRSAYVSGGVPAVVTECHEGEPADKKFTGTPERYDLLLQSRDGQSLATFSAPVHILCGQNGEGMPQESLL